MCPDRPAGALVVLVAVQVFVPGLYLPPVFKEYRSYYPPQTIISLPVQTAVCSLSASGRVGGAGGCPTVGAGLYLPPVFRSLLPINPPQTIISLAGPDCRVKLSTGGRVSDAGCDSNYPCWDCISRQCSNRNRLIRPRRSFHCRSRLPYDGSGSRRVGDVGGCPTVRAGIVSTAGDRRRCQSSPSAPDDHFTARPHCRVA